jgi:hypothetical protein
MLIDVKSPIPKKVKCTVSASKNYQEGITYSVTTNQEVMGEEVNGTLWNNKLNSCSKFEPIYYEEELLEYAKKMYPIGTKYKPLRVAVKSIEKAEVEAI